MKIRTVLVLGTAGPLLASCGTGSEAPTSTPGRGVESEAGAAPARGQEPGEPGIVSTVDVDERIDQHLEAGEVPLPNGRSEIWQSSHRVIIEEAHLEWTEDGQWLIHIDYSDYDVTYHGETGGLGGFYRVNPELSAGGETYSLPDSSDDGAAPVDSTFTFETDTPASRVTFSTQQAGLQRPVQRWQLRAAGGVRARSCRGRHRVKELTCSNPRPGRALTTWAHSSPCPDSPKKKEY